MIFHSPDIRPDDVINGPWASHKKSQNGEAREILSESCAGTQKSRPQNYAGCVFFAADSCRRDRKLSP